MAMALSSTIVIIKEKKEHIRKNSKKLLWTWVVYQTVKGTLTTSFIWIPLIYNFL